ncbi:hypothetical protein BZA05DRAFT_404085 [Tricharina praecox]|uniref:uncharacterized protein n=1 Tax=Tricharina praecox TaxID=43433 RepID=UPI0022203B57|nr:uncharacterized protein BZA05DRAFT_404085 [Tricharina praecox]KAI5847992.1 hypothetical protein BZA05DRAFT_404085 [Tricharina praecox]
MGETEPNAPAAGSDTVRLHITPLTTATAASILPAGTDLSTISFHALPTFPEASYGFVDLPVDAANKLKKKLHGAIFRGVKVRVQEARAEEWKKRTVEEVPEDNGKVGQKKRKRAREEGVLEGFEIGDRSVDGEKKKRKERGECLFKVVIPPNKTDNDVKKEKKKELSKEEKKEEKKAEKREGKDKKKKKVVKEFDHLEKFPQFLKISQLDMTRGKESLAAEFVEDVGWVDAKGEIVELPPKKKEKKQKKEKKEEKKEKKKEEAPEPAVEETATPGIVDFTEDIAVDIESIAEAMDIDDNVSVSSEEVFADVSDNVEESSETAKEDEKEEQDTMAAADADSSSESEDDGQEEDEDMAEDDSKSFVSKTEPESKAEEPAPAKVLSTPAKGKQVMSHTSLPPLAIHPLEALYKPAALDSDADPTEASGANVSAFKFGFGGDAEDSDDDVAPVSTPYRDPGRYRSSAPTPDTAIGTKRFFSPASISDDSGGEFYPTTPHTTSSSNVISDAPLLFLHEESRFLKGLSLWQQLPQPTALKPVEEPAKEEEGEAKLITDPVEIWKKRFYESRGEWNRDWKRRRKEGLKAKRKRERTGPGGSGANRA